MNRPADNIRAICGPISLIKSPRCQVAEISGLLRASATSSFRAQIILNLTEIDNLSAVSGYPERVWSGREHGSSMQPWVEDTSQRPVLHRIDTRATLLSTWPHVGQPPAVLWTPQSRPEHQDGQRSRSAGRGLTFRDSFQSGNIPTFRSKCLLELQRRNIHLRHGQLCVLQVLSYQQVLVVDCLQIDRSTGRATLVGRRAPPGESKSGQHSGCVCPQECFHGSQYVRF